MSTGTVWLSPADVTVLWRVPPGTVYRLASENAWRRRRVGRRAYYHCDDVERTLTR